MAKDRLTILEIAEHIPDEASAYKYLEELRWGGKPVCPHCGNDERCYYLNPADGKSRATRTGTRSQRRVWKCKACRKQFSVLTGTIFHGTKIPVRTWVFVIFEMCASRHGVPAREIERRYGVAPKTSWRMLYRIREAMKRDPLAGLLPGTVAADETYIGGEPHNKHRQGKRRIQGFGKGKGGPGSAMADTKTAVLPLVDKETGEVRSTVVPDVGGQTLRQAIAEQVDMPTATLHTDGLHAHKQIAKNMEGREWVDRPPRVRAW